MAICKVNKLYPLTSIQIRPSITLIGAGNMAWHLGHALSRAGMKTDRIINRNENSGRLLAAELGISFSHKLRNSNPTSDILILAVSDSCIKEILQLLDISDSIILHTSGSTGMDVFENKFSHYGVLYPFQTLTKGVPVEFSEIPICIEASDPSTLKTISDLAHSLSGNVRNFTSGQRRRLHLSGVMANNFTNFLLTKSFEFLEKNSMDPQLLMPIVSETIQKLEKIPPKDAQTGPARRNNTEVIRHHLEMLDSDSELKKLYRLITDSIIAYYSK